MIDLSHYIRPHDAIVWTQTTAEPLVLTQALVEQRHRLGPCSVFVGATYSKTLQIEHQDCLQIKSFGGFGFNGPLINAGAMQVIPLHCSDIGSMLSRGDIACDVAMLQVSPPGPDGRYSLGISADYMVEAARRARVVLAEVNEQMPWTETADLLDGIAFDAVVHSNRPLLALPAVPIGETELKIASFAAQFIEDRTMLELGLGAIPDAILRQLTDRRDLGVHSGVVGDAVIDLLHQGVITNAYKRSAPGKVTTASLLGSQSLYDCARDHPHWFDFKPYAYTHAFQTLVQLENFVAVNSAIEVDLTGQVNAEYVNGRYIGATGGLVDFVRGALQAPGGRSIIALPSSTKGGQISRIVSQLKSGVVTSLRSDADVVVTEWGAAQLRGLSLSQRVHSMIQIAHPDHRDTLLQEAREHGLV